MMYCSRVDRRLCGPADADVAVGEGVLGAGEVVVAVVRVQEVGPVAALGAVHGAAVLALRRAAGHNVPHLLSKCQSNHIIVIVSNTLHTRFVCSMGHEALWNTLHGV